MQTTSHPSTATVLSFRGRLDAHRAAEVSAALAGAIGDLVLDLEQTAFVDQGVLRLIAAESQRRSAKGQELTVNRASGSVRVIVELARRAGILTSDECVLAVAA